MFAVDNKEFGVGPQQEDNIYQNNAILCFITIWKIMRSSLRDEWVCD